MKIVRNNESWIIKRLADELAGLDFPGLIYFMTYAMYEKTSQPSAALFTHFEENNAKRFENAARNVDFAIALSEKTAQDVRRYRKQCAVIHCGSDLRKEVVFGVVGRVYPSGRKGENLIAELSNEFNFLALGTGWPCKMVDVSREKFYTMIDYLVVPSIIEGGPIPVLDAIAMGVPVISGDVGWSWDYPGIRFSKGNVDSLRNVLLKLSAVRTWSDWKRDHKFLLNNFLKEKYAKKES